MRFLIGVIVAAAMWLMPQVASACGCCDHHHGEHAAAKPSAAERQLGPGEARLRMPVAGMHCDHCVSRVEAALVKLQGVKVAEASLEDAEAIVIFEKGKLDAIKVAQAIDALGFKAGAAVEN